MFGGTKLSKKSALAMNTVAEEADGNDLDERQSSVGTTTQNQAESSSSSFSLARQETRMLMYSKFLVIAVVLTLAITLGCVTYKITRNQEMTNYRTKFRTIAGQVSAAVKDRVYNTFESLEKLSTEITTDTVEDGTVWPFVNAHNFEVKGELSNADVGANTLSMVPLVYDKDLDEWDRFSSENSGWIADGHHIDSVIAEDIFVREFFEYREEDEEEPEGESWSEEGVTPFLWKYKNGTLQDPHHDYRERERVEQCARYAPVWQTAPAPDFASIVNLDLHSLRNPGSGYGVDRYIDAMLSAGEGVLTEVTDHHHLLRHYDHRFRGEDMVQPHSYAFQPIFDSLMAGNRTIVGFLASFFPWGAMLTKIVSSSEEGIVIILENTCNQAYTYEVFGQNAEYYGKGDLHAVDSVSYDGEHFIKAVTEDMVEHFDVPIFHRLRDGVNRMESHNLCEFQITMYPDFEFRDQFFTNMPYAYAASVVACFVVTTLVFAAYDILVQRRQKLVMDQAKKTTAIVNSLFPANVRERLMDEVQDRTLEGKPETNKAAFLSRMKKDLAGPKDAMTSESIYGSKPIADLFPDVTIMFADIVGFTAWSSIREPAQVFSLLETIYHSFDVIAARRRVFKVETIGDCYVAVAGLPVPRADHFLAMAKFASDCLQRMQDVVNSLDKSLGPGTSELNMRFGLHSGQVTAGVLRGEKGRFQLFGDSMNTASRMESTSLAGRIQISAGTADLLIAGGREKWVIPRKEVVMAKGLGAMHTYWLRVSSESEGTGSRMTSTSFDSADREMKLDREQQRGLILLNKVKSEETELGALPPKIQRMVEWNVDVLVKLLQKIVARRESSGTVKHMKKREARKLSVGNGDDCTVLDEVQDILALPQFDAKAFRNLVDPDTIPISDEIIKQLTDYLAKVAGLYRNNPFHNFGHASHVTMSISKLLSRIVSPNEVSTRQRSDNEIAANLHDHTFGITSDPLTQFACILSGLIHDADHPGVPNSILVKEGDPLAAKYKGKSVAEQNSVDLAWGILMDPQYKELRAVIYANKDEFERFRSIVVNIVMATDIMDKELGAQRRQRWDKAFSDEASKDDDDHHVTTNRKATIVLEHLMQASDVAHTMQHWTVYRKFNENLFREMYKAYKDGRSETDPSRGWYKGELGFFDFYVIPLAKKLDKCGVFGVSSQEYLNYAISNRHEWQEKGERMVHEYVERLQSESEEGGGSGGE